MKERWQTKGFGLETDKQRREREKREKEEEKERKRLAEMSREEDRKLENKMWGQLHPLTDPATAERLVYGSSPMHRFGEYPVWY